MIFSEDVVSSFTSFYVFFVSSNNEPLPFWIHNPCSGQTPIYELPVFRVCWHKTQPLVSYPRGRLASFSSSLFLASMRSVLSQQTPGYWTLHRLMSAMLRQTGIHCPRVWSTNVCSWLIDQTSPPQIIYVQNQLIFSVFVPCFVWMFLQIYNVIPLHSSRCLKWCHSIAVTWGFGTLSYFVVTQFFLSLCNQCLIVCKSTFEDTTCNLFRPRLVAVIITSIVVTTGQTSWVINGLKFQLTQISGVTSILG